MGMFLTFESRLSWGGRDEKEERVRWRNKCYSLLLMSGPITPPSRRPQAQGTDTGAPGWAGQSLTAAVWQHDAKVL